MKTCSKCKQEKDLSEFNKNRCKADGHSTLCRVCHGEHNRAYYAINGERQRKQIRAANARRTRANYQKLWALLNRSRCADCSNADPRVLEFDHLPQYEKRLEISKLIGGGYSWEAVEDEIKKCDIVCANCHHIRTAERAGTYRSLAFSG